MVETCLLLSDLDNKDCWRCCITFRKFMIMVVIIFMQKMHQPFKRQSQSSANCRQIECVWPFYEIGAERVKMQNMHIGNEDNALLQ